ncbi:hypothetical protein [Undibacterium sp. GrIS 1.8]|uniref:hypothetical protein n=1 Tax=Undibacterium sp. GrIS 1.8 TaxID=3143934 RepID=UPI003390EABC
MLDELNTADSEYFSATLESFGAGGHVDFFSLTHVGNVNWKFLNLPYGTGLGEEIFAKIANVAATCEDSELIISDIFKSTPKNNLVAIKVEYEDFTNLICGSRKYDVSDIAMVGRSGRWLAILSCHVGILAASEETMVASGILSSDLTDSIVEARIERI